jgi:hypothetical protein
VAKGIRSSTLDKLRKVIGHISAAKSAFEGSISGDKSILNDDLDPKDDPANTIVRFSTVLIFVFAQLLRKTNLMNIFRDKILSLKMNTREKVMILESLKNSFYETAGHFQQHLDKATLIREKFTATVNMKSSVDGMVRVVPYFLVPGNVSLSETHWDAIENWNKESTSICSEALLQLTMDSKQFDLEGFQFPVRLNNTIIRAANESSRRSFIEKLRGGMMSLASTDAIRMHDNVTSGFGSNFIDNSERLCIVAADKSLLEEQLGWKIRVDDDQIPLVDTSPHLVRDSNILTINQNMLLGLDAGHEIIGTLELPMDIESVLGSLIFDDSITTAAITKSGSSFITCTPWMKFSDLDELLPASAASLDTDSIWIQNGTYNFMAGKFRFLYMKPTMVHISRVLLPVSGVSLSSDKQPWTMIQYLNYTEHKKGSQFKVTWLIETLENSSSVVGASSESEPSNVSVARTRLTAFMTPISRSQCPFMPTSSVPALFSAEPALAAATSEYVWSLLQQYNISCHALVRLSNSNDILTLSSYLDHKSPRYMINMERRGKENVMDSEDIPSIPEKALFEAMSSLKKQSRRHSEISSQIALVENTFVENLEMLQLRDKPNKRFLSILKPRVLLKVLSSFAVIGAGYQVYQNPAELQKRSKKVSKHTKNFFKKRLQEPLKNIINDVFLNKKLLLADQVALKDAQRSLGVMLNDFLTQYRSSLPEKERSKIVSNLDMTPISQEYEVELRRPVPNILSGRIARLVLIQLQFVKKELLVAMQAIDELLNANQVNLQLLAITPAIFSGILLQNFVKVLVGVLSYSSRGKFMDSIATAHRELRLGVRQLEKILGVLDRDTLTGDMRGSPRNSTLLLQSSVDRFYDPNFLLTKADFGRIMSVLYRLQNSLVLHHSHFDALTLTQLQEDLRDITQPSLSPRQRLNIVERIMRSYSFIGSQK